MNKERRDRLNDALLALETAKGTIEQITQEEQDAFDNLPEGLQRSDRGEAMEEAIQALEEATNDIDNAIGNIDDAKGS